MRTSAALLLIVSSLLLVSGCSDPLAGNSQATFDRLCGEVCDGISDLADHLAAVEDAPSLDGAMPKIRADVDRIVAAIERQRELVSDGLVPDKSSEAKWKEKLAEASKRVAGEAVRLASIPDANEVNKRLRDELGRMTSIPRPPVRNRPVAKRGGPKVSKQMEDDLRALGRVYTDCKKSTKKYASSWEEAEAYCKTSGRQADVEMLRRLRGQGVTVHWGMELRYAYVGTMNYVFAYEKKTPTVGGLVLHLDGTTEAATPGRLMAFLAFQVKCDLKMFGKSPPVPVKFAAGTTPEPKPWVQMDLSEPWPPTSSSMSQSAPAQEHTSPPSEPVPNAPTGTGRPPSAVSYGNAPQSSARPNTIDSPLVGGGHGSSRLHREVDSQGRPMIGYRYRMGTRAGQDVVQKFDPLFESQRPHPTYTDVMAKDGYAVGAIQVDGDQHVNAIRVAFMRIDGQRLDTNDSYVSDWIGKPTGRPPKTLNSNGALVLGVHRRGLVMLEAVGLVFKAQ